MRLGWLVKGLKTGVVTTRYPAVSEPQPEPWRGRPVLDAQACRAADGCAACVTVCLPEALHLAPPVDARAGRSPGGMVLDYGRCIMCGLCVPACPTGALRMQPDYELAVRAAADLRVTVRWTTDGATRDGRD
jgi:formate hydrogenlyase subunit 6/NADH:ubiquinone oxidoreductase subunit I